MIQDDFLKWFQIHFYNSSYCGFTYNEVIALFKNLNTLEIYQIIFNLFIILILQQG